MSTTDNKSSAIKPGDLRECGFYWVKFFKSIGWEISYFDAISGKWMLIQESIGTYHPIEINENRILNPDGG